MGGFFSKSKKLNRDSSSRSSGRSWSKKEKSKKRRSTISSADVPKPQVYSEQNNSSNTASINRRRSFGSSLSKSNSAKDNRASAPLVTKKALTEQTTEDSADVTRVNSITRQKFDDKNSTRASIKSKGSDVKSEIPYKPYTSFNDEPKPVMYTRPIGDTSLDRSKRRSLSSSRLSLNYKRDKTTISSYEMPKDYISVSSNRLNHVSNLQGMKQDLRNSIQNVIESMQPAEIKNVPIYNKESMYLSNHRYNVKKRSIDRHSMRPVSNIYDSVTFPSTFAPAPPKREPSISYENITQNNSNEGINRKSQYYESDPIAYAVVNIQDIKDQSHTNINKSYQNMIVNDTKKDAETVDADKENYEPIEFKPLSPKKPIETDIDSIINLNEIAKQQKIENMANTKTSKVNSISNDHVMYTNIQNIDNVKDSDLKMDNANNLKNVTDVNVTKISNTKDAKVTKITSVININIIKANSIKNDKIDEVSDKNIYKIKSIAVTDTQSRNDANSNEVNAKVNKVNSNKVTENDTNRRFVLLSTKSEEANISDEEVSADESVNGSLRPKPYCSMNDIYSEDSLDDLSDSSDDLEDSSWTYKDFNNRTSQLARSRAPMICEEDDDSDSSVEYVGGITKDSIDVKKSPKKIALKRNRVNAEKPSKWATKEQTDIYTRDCQPNGPNAPYTGYVIPRVRPVYSKKHRRDERDHQIHQQYSGEEHDDWSPDRSEGTAEHGSVKDKAKIYEERGMIVGLGDQRRIKDRTGSSPPLPPPYRIPDPRLHQLEFRSSPNFDGSRPPRAISLGAQKVERVAVTKDILHCGNVRVVKKAENGIKIPKQWHDNFLILKRDRMEFYDSEKAWRDQHLYRFDIVLKEGLVDLENVKKRLKIVDANNDMYVTEHPNEREAKEWMAMIRSNALVIASASQPSPLASPSPTMARHRTKSTSKAASDESVNDIPSTGGSQENIPKNNRTTSKILDKWLRKRPQKDALINKGIYQDEAVFGRNLWEVCPLERPRIPEFVVRCVRVLEGKVSNLTTDGIYRASGNLSQIQRIRLEVNQKNLSVVNDTVDIHVLTGVLKLFFRELKEPLIPFEFFQKCINASSKKDHDTRVKEFRDIIRKLPDCNKDTLTFFLEHLLNVVKYEEKNRMTISNLAIVLGPTILWAPPNATQNLAVDFLKQNEVIEILLKDFKEIFAEDGKDFKRFETKM